MKGEIVSLKTAKAIMKLQEENKKLKQWDINKDTRNSRQRVEIKRLLRQNKELQQRIDKAIEYIKSHNPSDIGICGNEKKYYYTLDEDSVDNLLEILEGKDE